MATNQDKKNIKKSGIQFRPGTQEEADRKNSGGATQIVLKRREPKYEVSRKNLKGRNDWDTKTGASKGVPVFSVDESIAVRYDGGKKTYGWCE